MMTKPTRIPSPSPPSSLQFAKMEEEGLGAFNHVTPFIVRNVHPTVV